ncbi:MAG: hypothetical protein ACYC61_18265 [Isosphaeraceae bacterium]
MLWRHLCLARAWAAAGLVGGTICLSGPAATAQSPAKVPVGTAAPARPAIGDEPSAPPAGLATDTVDILQAGKTGELSVAVHGHGQDKVRLTLRNSGKRRLNVIIPPGLVAASRVAQAGGGGAGGRLQSIGLGSVTNREGAFGEFQADAPAGGLRSVPVTGEPGSRSVAVPAGESIDVSIPGVCLNYGRPAPTPRDTLSLMDVDTYTTDPRIRKALRTLATVGTSHGVAQAVMWNLCDDLSFEQMMEQSGKVMNASEVALAARFVEALGESTEGDTIAASAFADARIIVKVEGQGALAEDARRLTAKLDGMRILGLPVKAVEGDTTPACSAPALGIRVILTDSQTAETRGRIVVSTIGSSGSWTSLGNTSFREPSSISVVDGATLARSIDRAVSGAFVTVKPARRVVGSTTLKVENRLPFTITGVVVRAGNSSGAPSVPFAAVGVGPARSALLPLQAASASLVEHVDLNGL